MVLLIDNYDSFTYNLVHYFETLGADMKVVRNDAATSRELMALSPKAAVISPGPSSRRMRESAWISYANAPVKSPCSACASECSRSATPLAER